MSATIKDYSIHVFWDGRAGYYVAEIPEIPTCAADGATQVEALANLEETFAVMKEAYLEETVALPSPNPRLPISIATLSSLSPLVKIAKIAEFAGIPAQTLAAKLRRGTEFSPGEARDITRVLSEHGLTLQEPQATFNATPENLRSKTAKRRPSPARKRPS